jgi:hypothetical protein
VSQAIIEINPHHLQEVFEVAPPLESIKTKMKSMTPPKPSMVERQTSHQS